MRKERNHEEREKVSEKVWSLLEASSPKKRQQAHLATQERTFEGMVDYFYNKYKSYLKSHKDIEPITAHNLAMSKIERYFETRRLKDKVCRIKKRLKLRQSQGDQ
jgi:hypothetical protein